ncbi:LysR family transcriptional regulator [Paenibacillus sp. sgz500958]|uniref:LysR family transcriptional regulator n=1 Tax=Paenibacillus sp. sgz500958 TaxID=3242475 RepID=UPI0036D3F237
MDIKYLQTFKAIIGEGSFTKAAAKLNYTQSTITFQMKQLEQELSIQIFEKVGRNMNLTKAGKELIPYVDEVLASLDRLSGIGGSLEQLKGELYVDVAETILCYQMAPVLKEFHRLAPKAKLFLRSTNCYEILEKLRTGQTDLGVFYLDERHAGDYLEVHKLGECTMDLVASAKTKESFPDFITPDRNLDLPFIINEPDCIFRQIFEDYIRSRKITMGHTIELWSIPTIINLVKNNLGISYLPSFTVRDDLENGELFKIGTAIDDRKLTAVCAHHKNKWVNPVMKLFIELTTRRELGTQHSESIGNGTGIGLHLS